MKTKIEYEYKVRYFGSHLQPANEHGLGSVQCPEGIVAVQWFNFDRQPRRWYVVLDFVSCGIKYSRTVMRGAPTRLGLVRMARRYAKEIAE